MFWSGARRRPENPGRRTISVYLPRGHARKKPKLRHRQINHVGLNTSFSEIFALYIVSKRALVLKNFWTTNIRGIHIVTLLVVKCGDEITPKFLKPGKILQRLEDAPFVKNCQPDSDRLLSIIPTPRAGQTFMKKLCISVIWPNDVMPFRSIRSLRKFCFLRAPKHGDSGQYQPPRSGLVQHIGCAARDIAVAHAGVFVPCAVPASHYSNIPRLEY